MFILNYVIRRPVTVGVAPYGSICQWCSKAASLRITVQGDKDHNEGQYFCQSCGDEFVRTVADTLMREVTVEEYTGDESITVGRC